MLALEKKRPKKKGKKKKKEQQTVVLRIEVFLWIVFYTYKEFTSARQKKKNAGHKKY